MTDFTVFPEVSKSRLWWMTVDTAFQNWRPLTENECPASCFLILHVQSSNVWISVEFDLAVYHREKSNLSINGTRFHTTVFNEVLVYQTVWWEKGLSL